MNFLWFHYGTLAVKLMTHVPVSDADLWYRKSVSVNWYHFLAPVGLTHD